MSDGSANGRWGKLQVVLAFFGVFALGGVAGGAVEHLRTARELRSGRQAPRAGRVEARLAALRRRLDLTPEQDRAVETIVREHEARREELSATCRPSLRQAHEEAMRRLEDVLAPEQRPRFRELLERWQRRAPR